MPTTATTGVTDVPTETVDAWGMNTSSKSPVIRPRSVDELRTALMQARKHGSCAGLRGAGCSYGDASLNSDGLVLDFTGMREILAFDPETGVLDAEPGVTIEQVWRHALPHGWWPPVVPGTMYPTLGGCAAMNIHGKNNFQAGTIGRHIREFDLILADGSMRTCSRDLEPELFRAAIGGFGMLGVFTRISLQLRRVSSGDLWVQPITRPNLTELVAYFEDHWEASDYLVGWIDGFGGGRGVIHQAWYLNPDEDEATKRTLTEEHQDLPARLFKVIPRSWLWWGLWCFFHRPGMRLVNAIKYWLGRRSAKHLRRHRQALVGFSFLLDYLPGWKHAYKPGSFIQYQTFVPKENAVAVFEAQLRLAKEHGVQPFLGVLKKHLPDPFLMTHAVDGYSLALDFPLARDGKDRMWRLARAMDDVVLEGGGRFYLAKDSTMTPEVFEAAYPDEALRRFRDLKRELDPASLFQTDLSRRLLTPSTR